VPRVGTATLAPKVIREQRQHFRRDEAVTVDPLHHAVPSRHTDDWMCALSNDRPTSSENIRRYLKSKDALDEI
jgi:hypothetical protein